MIFRFDPRTKMLLICMLILCTTFMPSLEIEMVVVLVIACFGIMCGRWKKALGWSAFFVILYFAWNTFLLSQTGTGHTMAIAWVGLLFKVIPCCMMSDIAIATTQINEFLTAMNKMRIPHQITIPIAVLFRYIPTVCEDWRYIKDAMLLRGVSPSLLGFVKQPFVTIECLYVPLLITASKTADELSIAAVTRGIENKANRSSITEIRMKIHDYIVCFFFGVMTLGILAC